MKTIICFVAIILFVLPKSNGQTFASVAQCKNSEITSYSNLDFVTYRTHQPPNKKMLTGGILAGSGVVLFGSGAFVLMFLTYGPDRDKGEINYSNQSLGFGLMGAGCAAAITGLVFVIQGHREKKWGWSLQPISPKRNELGIAYNF